MKSVSKQAENVFRAAINRVHKQKFDGVECECEVRPQWHIRQNGDKNKFPKAFGAEIEVL